MRTQADDSSGLTARDVRTVAPGAALAEALASHFADAEVEELARRYRDADPFPHIAIDGLFPESLLRQLFDEISSLKIDAEKNTYSTYLKHRISDLDRLPPTARELVITLNSAKFLGLLEKITGIAGLVPDPYLEGGGVHQIGVGGYLKIHTDFNYHERLRLHRRLNLLLYFTPDWREEWGGAVEFWNEDVSQRRASYPPAFNRLVLFSTTDRSYHGHPDPLQCPADVRRNSIALYYYTADRPEEEVKFAKSTMTNYQLRPAENFEKGRLHHLLNQLEIRWPAFRGLLNLIRRAR